MIMIGSFPLQVDMVSLFSYNSIHHRPIHHDIFAGTGCAIPPSLPVYTGELGRNCQTMTVSRNQGICIYNWR
jgi:hypothetical protein